MNYFSKKTTTILLISTTILLIAGCLLVLFSNAFIQAAYTFLSQQVFHREFSLEKWQASIESFFMIPAFLVIFANACIFFKYTAKVKIILLAEALIVIMVMITFTTATRTMQHVNSDLAAEILLAKECVLEKSFWPVGWHYSTEIRLLNTQLFTAPVFLFTQNWNTVKTWQSVLSCLVLFAGMWYLLGQLSIRQFWIKFWAGVLSICPCSWIAWYVGAWGNYYIPHAAMSFIYVATFIKLVWRQDTLRRRQAWRVFFFAWAFVSGFSTLRYVLNYVLPLLITVLIMEQTDKEKKAGMERPAFWLHNPAVFYSVTGLLSSGLGYVANNLILRHFYSFSEWNSLSFNTIGDITLTDILRGILELFGYQENIAVMTPGGVINVLVYCALAMLAVYVMQVLKKPLEKPRRCIVLFTTVSFLFSTFTYVHMDYIARYYYPILLYVFPCLAIFISEDTFTGLKKYFLGTVWSVVIVTASLTTMQNQLTTDENKDKYAVERFLEDNGYTFGFATMWNANVFTYLSNGKIEVGNLYKAKTTPEHIYITDTYKYDKWLTPARYYTSDHEGKRVFLLVDQDQYQVSSELRIFSTGTLVYNDEYYRVYDYPSFKEFKESF